VLWPVLRISPNVQVWVGLITPSVCKVARRSAVRSVRDTERYVVCQRSCGTSIYEV